MSQDDTKTMLSPTDVIPMAPTSFGNYTLVARLGRGGMADICLAIYAGRSGFRKLVVVKRLRESYEDDTRLVEMFMDEARLGARLEHPNLVHAFDLGSSEGHHFLAMEYLEGQTLARVIRRVIRRGDVVPFELLLHVAMEVLEGLHHAHELRDFDGTPLGVVHRDVTPANVMITYAGVVKLLDFGVAKSATQMSETQPDVRKGKFAYLSPEQIEGRVDRRSDLFSFGVILWEAIAGRRLFLAEHPAATMKKVVSAPISTLDLVTDRKVPPGLDAVVQKALARSPALRYQTAAEMRRDIEAIVERERLGMRRSDLASFMADVFADLREQHGRDIADAVTAGLDTATQMFEVLGPLTTPRLARADIARAGEAALSPPTKTPIAPGDDELDGQAVAVLRQDPWPFGSSRPTQAMKLAAVGTALGLLIVVGVAVASSEDVDELEKLDKVAALVQPSPSESLGEPSDRQESAPRRRGPAEFEARRALGRTQFAAGRYAEAVEAYTEATRMNPAHAGSFAALGACELARGRVEQGLAAYQEAVRLAPTHSGFHAALGRAYREAERDDLALEAYREAYRLDRGNRAARRAIRELERR